MAAGIIYQTVTTTTGETVELAFYVDETSSPTTWIPVSLPVNASGAALAFGSGANGATVQRVALATDSPGVTTLGQTTKSGSLPVTIASDQEIAHDAADSGNPTKVGGRATSAEPTAVASGDRANFYTDLTGRQVIAPYALPGLALQGNPSVITGTSSTEVVAAQGAGVRFYMTSLLVTNSDATVGTLVSITDGSGGTVLAQGYAAAGGGGFSITFPVPCRTTANTALHAVCGTTSAEVYVSAHGYSGV